MVVFGGWGGGGGGRGGMHAWLAPCLAVPSSCFAAVSKAPSPGAICAFSMAEAAQGRNVVASGFMLFNGLRLPWSRRRNDSVLACASCGRPPSIWMEHSRTEKYGRITIDGSAATRPDMAACGVQHRQNVANRIAIKINKNVNITASRVKKGAPRVSTRLRSTRINR